MSRTDSILTLIRAELERQRVAIDCDDGLRSIRLVVRISDRSGLPFKILYQPETEHDACTLGLDIR